MVWTVTIDDVMPCHVLISRDADVSLVSLHVFMTLQIPASSLTLAPPIRGPNGDVMETHGSIILFVALGVADNFQTFLINFFIVDPCFLMKLSFHGESATLRRRHRHRAVCWLLHQRQSASPLLRSLQVHVCVSTMIKKTKGNFICSSMMCGYLVLDMRERVENDVFNIVSLG
jgi:hypothetical protein